MYVKYIGICISKLLIPILTIIHRERGLSTYRRFASVDLKISTLAVTINVSSMWFQSIGVLMKDNLSIVEFFYDISIYFE